MSSQANISDTPFDQKTPGHPEVGVLRRHKQIDRQTNGHRNSMPELAQWADSVKIPKYVNKRSDTSYFYFLWISKQPINIVDLITFLLFILIVMNITNDLQYRAC